MKEENEIKVVIGSWGSYTECNEKSLGSEWLTFNDYTDFEEIREELQKEGFELDGIDEELFIQDIEGIYESSYSWDCCNPETLFNRLYDSGVLTDDNKYELMQAYLENEMLDDWLDLVKENGENWDENIYLRSDCKDWDDYGRELIAEREIEIPNDLENYFDYESYGEDQAQYANTYLTEYGVLENFN